MCFSASVSYGTGALLMVTGAVTSVGNSSKQQRMIAAVPFIFGLQQIAEGIVWQTMDEVVPSALRQFGAVMFLVFAYLVWTAWMPWCLYFVEPREKRRRILKVIGVIGIGVSAMAGWVLFNAEVQAYMVRHSLAYSFPGLNRFWPANLEAILYVTPTVIPFFVSSLRTIKIAGVFIAGSMLIAKIINQEAASSIWCFFAALISFFIAANVLWLQKGKLS